jgi:hypothetical protein
MINPPNTDHDTHGTGLLPFPGGLDRSNLRLTRAEFARFIGTSKQSVGEWCKAGKITLGADGRVDPRVAVSQLLRNCDPARLRSKVLAPLVRDIGALQKRIADLEVALAEANEMAEFHESASLEFLGQQTALHQCLHDERDELVKLPADKVIAGVIAWLNEVAEAGDCDILPIMDCVPVSAAGLPEDSPSGALEVEQGGGG